VSLSNRDIKMKSSFEILNVFGSMIRKNDKTKTKQTIRTAALICASILFITACDVCEPIKPAKYESEIYFSAMPLTESVPSIYGIDAQGADLREIIKNGVLCSAPAINGNFAFIREEAGSTSLMIYEGEDAGVKKVQLGEAYKNPGDAVISAKGNYLAFTAEHLGDRVLVLQDNSIGAVQKEVSQKYLLGSGFAFSPDNEYLAFFEEDPGIILKIIHTDDLAVKETNFYPAGSVKLSSEARVEWSQDSQWITYTLNEEDEDQIYVRSLNGTIGRKYTAKKFGALHPVFAQDETDLCCSGRLGHIHRYDVATDTTRRYYLVKADTSFEMNKYPRWSSEGEDKVIYSCYPKHNTEGKFSAVLKIVSDVYNTDYEKMRHRVLCSNVYKAFWRRK
jgi:hypothetical protein